MPADSDPQVRARHLQEWLAAVAREEDPFRARFFAALPARTKAAIDGAASVSWLPVGLHVELADVLHDAFGAARAHAYYRRAFAASLRGPVLGPLLRTGMSLLGVTPATLLRWADKGWSSSFRRCGSLHGEVLGPGRGRLVYRGLPAVCVASDAWLDSAQGSAYGVYDLLRCDGIVRLDKGRRDEGCMQLELEWRARG